MKRCDTKASTSFADWRSMDRTVKSMAVGYLQRRGEPLMSSPVQSILEMPPRRSSVSIGMVLGSIHFMQGCLNCSFTVQTEEF
jgi:hypothetical protein